MGGFLMVGILLAFLAGPGGDLLRHPRAVPDRLGRLRAADVRPDPLRDQQHHPRRRDRLRTGHRDAVRLDLQPLHQPAAPAGLHERGRLSTMPALIQRLRALAPSREQLEANPWLRRRRLTSPTRNSWCWSRRGVAMGVAIGLFIGLPRSPSPSSCSPLRQPSSCAPTCRSQPPARW